VPHPYFGLAWGGNCSFRGTRAGGRSVFPFSSSLGTLEDCSVSKDVFMITPQPKTPLQHVPCTLTKTLPASKHGRLYGICTIDPTICASGLYRAGAKARACKANRGFPCAPPSLPPGHPSVLHPVARLPARAASHSGSCTARAADTQ